MKVSVHEPASTLCLVACVRVCLYLCLISDGNLERLQRDALRVYAGTGPEDAAAGGRRIQRDVANATRYQALASGPRLVLRRRRQDAAHPETRPCAEGIRIAEFGASLGPSGSAPRPPSVAVSPQFAVSPQPAADVASSQSASAAATPHSTLPTAFSQSSGAAAATATTLGLLPRARHHTAPGRQRPSPYGWGVDGGGPCHRPPLQSLDFDMVMRGPDAASGDAHLAHASAEAAVSPPAAGTASASAELASAPPPPGTALASAEFAATPPTVGTASGSAAFHAAPPAAGELIAESGREPVGVSPHQPTRVSTRRSAALRQDSATQASSPTTGTGGIDDVLRVGGACVSGSRWARTVWVHACVWFVY
eukprot:GHVU01007723.1.p1 GENE.GHVU01007723.1~~GHVU01007723.1.p1  ORF type:complete len:366 (-),score=30.43 GHVU01007723.1:726-1823(-)